MTTPIHPPSQPKPPTVEMAIQALASMPKNDAHDVIFRFLDALQKRADKNTDVELTEKQCFKIEASWQHGFETIDDNIDLMVVNCADFVRFIEIVEQCTLEKANKT